MHISKSSLNTYLQCPRRFKYNYLDKLKPAETSPQAQRGIDVHNFCNEFYDHIDFHNKHFDIDINFLGPWMESCSDEAKLCIQNFIDFEYRRWNICRSLYPVNPKKLFIPLLRESKFVSEKLQQVTIIDRLDQRLDGNYTLVEYKSERFQDKDWKKTEFRREMALEKSTLETSPEFTKKFPNDIVDFVVYFPRSNDIMMEKFNWRSMKAMQNAIEKMRRAIDLGSFPCNVEYHCRFCNFSLGICNMEFETK